MTHTSVLNKITELGYKGFKEAYIRQMEDVNYHNLSFEDRLYQLLDAQDAFLNNSRIQMNLKLSKIKNKQALIDFSFWIIINKRSPPNRKCLEPAFENKQRTQKIGSNFSR